MFSLTFTFKDIFPAYDSFSKFVTDEGIDPLTGAENIAFAQYVYKVLFREYKHSNVQYDVPEDFLADFGNVLQEHWDQYMTQKALIAKIHSITDADLLLIGKRLQNVSNNPNMLPEDPTAPINFITSQVYEQTTDNRLRAYIEALNRMPSTRQYEFAERFRKLFKPYYQTDRYYYVDGG